MDNKEDMSQTSNDEIFAVDSQIELLNSIQTHVDAEVPFICVEGAKGSGKSWLSQSYLLIEHEDDVVQALLICSDTQSLNQQREILIGQLLPKCIIEDDTIIDSLLSFRDEKEFVATIIIDDAEKLKPELLEELAQTVLNAKQQNHWKISVIFFAQTDYLSNILSTVEIKPESVLLNIEPFNEQEKENFAEAIIFPLISNQKHEDKIRNELPKTPSYPANLLQLAHRYKRNNFDWIRPALIAILVIVVMIGWLTSWYKNYNPNDTKTTDTLAETSSASTSESDITLSSNSTIIDNNAPESKNNTNSSNNINNENSNQKEEDVASSGNSDKVIDGNESLPPKITGSTDNDGAIIASNNQIETKTPTDNKKEVKETTDVSAEKTSSINEQWDNQELLNIAPDRYTVQLATFANKNNAIRFPVTNKLQDGTRIYSTNHNGRTFYVVTYKDFASISEAQSIISTLPEKVRNDQPWVKSIKNIHNEIKKSN